MTIFKGLKGMNKVLSLYGLCFLFICFTSQAESMITPGKHFYVLPLGTSGGELEDNLSSYLISAANSPADFVAVDAGTLCSSIKKIPLKEYRKLGIQSSEKKSMGEVLLTQYIKTYLISHAHLDHINGLVMCSPIDSHKEIMGTDTTIDYLRDNIFNWKIWPNLTNEGFLPQIKQYHYHRLSYANQDLLPGTQMKVKPFLLSHGNGYPSTAFLLESHGYYLLYFGDTGPDPLEHSQDIHLVWEAIAPLIRAHMLTAIFIEASYPNDRPDKLLFGHLTPNWLLFELKDLAHIVNPQNPLTSLQGLKIVVTHIKQGLEKQEINRIISEQLAEKNNLGVKFIIPQPIQPMIF